MKRLGLDGPPPRLDPPPGLADRTCAFVREHADRLLVTPVRAAVFQAAQRERHFTWSDFVTMAAVVVAAASLFFPALSLSHFQANINTCQNQLRLVGYALHEFSDRQPDHRFPGPEAEGNRAAAGIVAPILVSQRLADAQFSLPGIAFGSRVWAVPHAFARGGGRGHGSGSEGADEDDGR